MNSKRTIQRWMAAVLCAAGMVPVMWAQPQQRGRRPTIPEPKREAQPLALPDSKAPAGENAAAPVDPKTYKIGAEDVLQIIVWKEPDLSGIVNVRPDGMVTPALIGDVQVVGLTPEQFKEKLRVEFARFVNNPLVQVVVREVRSRKYYMVGNIKTGAFPLVVPTTVLEAITIAGGLSEYADKKNIIIMRGDKRIKFNYKDVIKGKKMEQNIYLENGDYIIVE